jgi:hypothetical protein
MGLLGALGAMHCAHELPPPCDAATAAGMAVENRIARRKCTLEGRVECPEVEAINRRADERRAHCRQVIEAEE